MTYVWSPVPPDCNGCEKDSKSGEYSRLDCAECINESKERKNKFLEGLDFASHQLGSLLSCDNEKVLVHCTAGMDRSPFVIAKYFVDRYGVTLGDAYGLIKMKKPDICEHYEWRWWPE